MGIVMFVYGQSMRVNPLMAFLSYFRILKLQEKPYLKLFYLGFNHYFLLKENKLH